jgi:hypothetical protein
MIHASFNLPGLRAVPLVSGFKRLICHFWRREGFAMTKWKHRATRVIASRSVGRARAYIAEQLESRILLTTVLSGQEVSGSISTGSPQATYTFAATANGTIEASVGDSGYGMEMELDLLNPNGTLLNSIAASGNGQTIALIAAPGTTGTYSILLKSVNGGTGSYVFSEASLPGTQTRDGYNFESAGGPVSSGQEVGGTLVGQLDAYSFTGTAGGTIEASVGDGGSAMEMGMDLFDPNGVLLKSMAATANGQIISIDQLASITGTYYIVIRSANGGTGSYQFSVTTTLSSPVLVSPGATSAPGQVTAPGATTVTWQTVPGADQYGLYISQLQPDGTYSLVLRNSNF